MSTEAAIEPTYGNWRRPRRAGLGPLGLVGTVGVFGGLVLVLLASLASLQAAFVVGVPLVVALLPMAVRTQDGRNLYQLLALRIGWSRRVARREHLYVSGPLSARPGGRFPPPGLLSGVLAREGRDAYDRPFGVLHHRAAASTRSCCAVSPTAVRWSTRSRSTPGCRCGASGCPGSPTNRGCAGRRWWWRPPRTRAPGWRRRCCPGWTPPPPPPPVRCSRRWSRTTRRRRRR